MEDYDDLVMRNQAGIIDDLEFLLEQNEHAKSYIADMQEKGLTPNAENAAEWLRNYENKNLYQ